MRAEYTTGEEGKGARVNEPFLFTLPVPRYPFPFYSSALILRPFFTFLIQREFLE